MTDWPSDRIVFERDPQLPTMNIADLPAIALHIAHVASCDELSAGWRS